MKYLTTILAILMLSGCMSKIKKISTVKSNPKPEIVKFEEIDIDNSGEISKTEFTTIKKNNNIIYTEPLWSFYGILGLVAALLIISNFLQRKKSKNV
jgi:hypothetical protein